MSTQDNPYEALWEKLVRREVGGRPAHGSVKVPSLTGGRRRTLGVSIGKGASSTTVDGRLVGGDSAGYVDSTEMRAIKAIENQTRFWLNRSKAIQDEMIMLDAALKKAASAAKKAHKEGMRYARLGREHTNRYYKT